MDWGVGPSGRERFAHALLTFMFFAPGDVALAALGPVRTTGPGYFRTQNFGEESVTFVTSQLSGSQDRPSFLPGTGERLG